MAVAPFIQSVRLNARFDVRHRSRPFDRRRPLLLTRAPPRYHPLSSSSSPFSPRHTLIPEELILQRLRRVIYFRFHIESRVPKKFPLFQCPRLFAKVIHIANRVESRIYTHTRSSWFWRRFIRRARSNAPTSSDKSSSTSDIDKLRPRPFVNSLYGYIFPALYAGDARVKQYTYIL